MKRGLVAAGLFFPGGGPLYFWTADASRGPLASVFHRIADSPPQQPNDDAPIAP
jgi:hypothetical protein